MALAVNQRWASLVESLIEKASDLGFDARLYVLNAADYGAPQRRKRGIFMAVRGIDEVPWPPERTHGPHSTTEQPYVTVRDAFEGLDLETTGIEVTTDSDGNQNLHFGRTARPEGHRCTGFVPARIPAPGKGVRRGSQGEALLRRCGRRQAPGPTPQSPDRRSIGVHPPADLSHRAG